MIEAVTEAFLTNASLNPVLERLRKASVHDCIMRRSAIIRVCSWEESKVDLAKRTFYARKRIKGNGSKLKRFASDEEKTWGELGLRRLFPFQERDLRKI